MTTRAASVRDLAHRRLRLTVVVASLIAAIVGSVVLATHRSGAKTTTRGITATLRVPGHPGSIAAGSNVLWVGMSGDPGRPAGNRPLLRVDLATGVVVQTVHLGGEVSSLVRDGQRLIVSVRPSGSAEPGPRRLVALNWRSGAVLPLGTTHLSDIDAQAIDGPVDQLVREGRALWGLELRPGRLLRLDPPSLAPVTAPIRLSSGRTAALAAGDRYLWATASDAGDVLRIDPTTSEVVPVRVGGSPAGLVVAGGHVWVADRSDGEIIRLDTRSLRQAGDRIQVGGTPASIGAAGDSLFVTDQDAGTVTRIDIRSGRPLGPPIRIAPADDDALTLATASGTAAVWVGSFASKTLTRISSRSAAAARSGQITVRGTGNGPVNPGPSGNGVTDGGVAGRGHFAVTGAIDDHGSYVGYRRVTGQIARVRTVMVGRRGTITVLNTIHLGVESRSVWTITSGTRAYAGLHGRGTVTVDNYQADPYTFVFQGTVSR